MRFVAAFFLLVAVACGAADKTVPATAPLAAAFPVTINAANGAVRIDRRPVRIVSLSPTATEMLFAISAGPQVIAVDDQSNYPANAPRTTLSGYQPNVEAIAAQKPDLVVVADAAPDLQSGLGALSIPVLSEPAAKTIDDTYTEIQQLGAATGHAAEAARVVASMKSNLTKIVDGAGRTDATYYHELDDTYFSVTSKTFIGQVYGLFGLKNIADAAPKAESGYPQLSAEYIVKADPHVIFLADATCCGVTAQKLAARPGWSGIAAVKDGRVVAVDADIASRWGPRIVDFARAVAATVKQTQPVEK